MTHQNLLALYDVDGQDMEIDFNKNCKLKMKIQ